MQQSVNSLGKLGLQRSRWDIMARILRVAKSSESKTHIMYGANLSFRQLERYLKLLVDSGFLRVTEARRSKVTKLFVTTDNGVSFLETYHRLEEIVKGKKHLNQIKSHYSKELEKLKEKTQKLEKYSKSINKLKKYISKSSK